MHKRGHHCVGPSQAVGLREKKNNQHEAMENSQRKGLILPHRDLPTSGSQVLNLKAGTSAAQIP